MSNMDDELLEVAAERKSNDQDSVAGDEDLSDDEFTDDDNSVTGSFIGPIDHGYMAEIMKVLKAKSEVKCENALQLNKELQQRLLSFRERLQSIIDKVKQRYKDNEERLKQNLVKKRVGVGIRGAYLMGGTFYLKGNMFFKDLNCRNCPNNADYEYRRNFENEMFTMDFELCARHVWSLMDKMGVVQAIKEQVIEYIRRREMTKKNPIKDQIKKSKLKMNISVHSEKLLDLLSKIDEHFKIDWDQISAHNLHYRHSPSSCKAMWDVYLQPSLKRTAWSDEENKCLLEATQKYNCQNWAAIAKMVPRRSEYQCFVQYQTFVCYMRSDRGTKWTQECDQRLLNLVERNTVNGVVNWSIVCAHFPHKPKTTLMSRYHISLNPSISHAPFTPEEDLMLLAAVEEFGEKFSCFPRTLFPNRSLPQLRSRYRNTLLCRQKMTPWTLSDDKKLMEFVAEHGTSSWLKCAQMIGGNHKRTSCRTRFLTIQKFFDKNPNTTLENLPRKKTLRLQNTITSENWIEKIAELRNNPNVNFKTEKTRKNRNKPATDDTNNANIPKKRKKQMSNERPIMFKEQSFYGINRLDRPISPKAPKSRRKELYVQRLRPFELKLYNYFRYSYNLHLDVDPCIATSTKYYPLCMVANALGFPMSSERMYMHDNTLPNYVHAKYNALIRRHNQNVPICSFGTYMPPSWTTTLGFRALCIQAAVMNFERPASTQETCERVEYNNAVQLFRQRLRVIFYKTTLLSRLNLNLIGCEIKAPEILPQQTICSEEDVDNTLTSKFKIEECMGKHVNKEVPLSQLKELSNIKHQKKTTNVITICDAVLNCAPKSVGKKYGTIKREIEMEHSDDEHEDVVVLQLKKLDNVNHKKKSKIVSSSIAHKRKNMCNESDLRTMSAKEMKYENIKTEIET